MLVTDCNSILSKWREHISQPLNIHGVSHVRQMEIQTAEQLVPEPSAFDVELAIDKAKKDAIHQILIKCQQHLPFQLIGSLSR